jgi:hypothetical protein
MGISLRRILSMGLSRRSGQHRIAPQDRLSVRVDVSHISSANIAEIFEEIATQIGRFPEDPVLKATRLDREARARRVAGLPEQPWNTTSG